MPIDTIKPNRPEYQLALNSDYYACMANDLILARQKTMSIWANRIINFLVMQLIAEDKDLKTYTVQIKDLAEFVGVNSNKIYEDIKSACSEIMHTVVEIGTGDAKQPWEMLHWISTARYHPKKGLTLALSEEVKPYLLDLKEKGFFTQYQIKEILPMTSFYAIRLYQYITMQVNLEEHRKLYHNYKERRSEFGLFYFDVSVVEMRKYFECQDKFKQIVQLKKGVIDTAVKQINENPAAKHYITDVQYLKTGKTVTEIRFEIDDAELRRRRNSIIDE